MKAVVILNANAGSLNGDKRSITDSDVHAAFRSHGTNVQLRNAPPAQLCETIRDAMQEHPDVIIVGGGDGSISTAAGCLAGTNIPLGILPMGTLNHFAHDLGLPTDWEKTVAVLAHGASRWVDVGEVNGRVFINNCSIGSYAEAVRKRDMLRSQHGKGKWWAMTLATIAVFRRLRRLRLRIDADQKTFSLRTPFVVVSNNRYSGRVLDQSLRPRLDDGQLWIYTTRADRHAAILRFAWQSLRREIDQVDGLENYSTSDAVITHDYGRLPIAIDGELASLNSPLRFRTRRGALRVLVPPESIAHSSPSHAEEIALDPPEVPVQS